MADGWIVRQAARRAGITKNVGAHTLRHAFITAAQMDAGVPLQDVQEAASHADPRTTMRYDKARELHQPGEIREVCPGTKGNVVPTAPHRSFVTWDYAKTSPPDARFARQPGKIMRADGRRGRGRPVQGKRVLMAPACGFGDQMAFKSISEDMASGPGR
jgi:hypothetical protein